MNELIDHLRMSDLTENEARTYLAFLTHGSMSGYEVAKKCNIARGNIYSCLQRLVDKGALANDENEKFTPVPLEIFFENYRLQLSHSQQSAVNLLKQQANKQQEEAQVLSLSGSDSVLRRCRSILCRPDSKLALIAAFSPELNALKEDIKGVQNSAKEINVLSFGCKPEWLNDASEHLSEDLIEKAQGGRLLMVASFPQALIAVIREDGTASGIWAWNRYLAAAIGLYISHEILITKMWPLIDEKTQKTILALSDLSSKIALAGVISDLPLDAFVSGVITPIGERNGTAY